MKKPLIERLEKYLLKKLIQLHQRSALKSKGKLTDEQLDNYNKRWCLYPTTMSRINYSVLN